MEFTARPAVMLSIVLLFLVIFCHHTGARELPEDEKTEALEDIILRAANMSIDDFELFYDKKDHVLLTEYDIAIPISQWGPTLVEGSLRQKRTAGAKPSSLRWPNKLVTYEINRKDFDTHWVNMIQSAMRDWSHYTCVKFQETTTAKSRIVIQDGKGCYSYVGKLGYAQKLGLASGCRNKRTILHELGHALGLYHEHNRPDRDDYITINLENIDSDERKNFNKKTWNQVIDLGLSYDYHSIMHYSNNAFGVGGRTTIRTKDSKYRNIIGKQDYMSFGDIKTINLMYNCDREIPDCQLKASDCPSKAFVGKDCTCWCPGYPAQYCSEEDLREKGDLRHKECKDKYSFCPKWAAKGDCETNASYMKGNCQLSCSFCQ